MTLLNSLLQECRYALDDLNPAAYVFDDLQLTSWINQCIAELNQFFPRRIVYTIGTTAGEHVYELEDTHLAVLQVEYPTGEEPPAYLHPLARTDPAFWTSDDHYEFVKSRDGDSLNLPYLVISDDPPDNETITLDLLVEHNLLTSGSDSCTVPDRLALPIIPLFVRWKAAQALATQESINPDILKPQVSAVEINAVRAERQYRAALEAARKGEGASGIASWTMDSKDRIY